MIGKIYRAARRRVLWLLWWLRCQRDPNAIVRHQLVGGAQFDYPLNSAIGRLLFQREFETHELEFMHRMLKSGDNVFDIGANAGMFTVVASKCVGANGRVYAFEPGTRELAQLRHNLALNNCTNVTIIERAVGRTTGVTKFGIARDGALNSLAQTEHPWQHIDTWQEVPITTLDDFALEVNAPRVSFIKIDVEGGEKDVIEGASNVLQNNPHCVVLFEALDVTAAGFGYTVQSLLESLLAHFSVGYINAKNQIVWIKQFEPRYGKSIYNFVLTSKA